MAKMSGECFIIPNRATRISEFAIDSIRNDMMELAKINGIDDQEFDVVQLWITNKGTENLRCHGFTDINGTEWGINTANVPVALFKGKKEGDMIEIKFPGFKRTKDGKSEDIILRMKLTLAQTKYRYRGFGKFEEVLAKVSS